MHTPSASTVDGCQHLISLRSTPRAQVACFVFIVVLLFLSLHHCIITIIITTNITTRSTPRAQATDSCYPFYRCIILFIIVLLLSLLLILCRGRHHGRRSRSRQASCTIFICSPQAFFSCTFLFFFGAQGTPSRQAFCTGSSKLRTNGRPST